MSPSRTTPSSVRASIEVDSLVKETRALLVGEVASEGDVSRHHNVPST